MEIHAQISATSLVASELPAAEKAKRDVAHALTIAVALALTVANAAHVVVMDALDILTTFAAAVATATSCATVDAASHASLQTYTLLPSQTENRQLLNGQALCAQWSLLDSLWSYWELAGQMTKKRQKVLGKSS